MDDDKVREEFKRGAKYNNIGFVIMLLSPFFLLILRGDIKYIITILIFGIGVCFQRQYKCPSCGLVFDPRLKSDELVFCPKCGKRLQ